MKYVIIGNQDTTEFDELYAMGPYYSKKEVEAANEFLNGDANHGQYRVVELEPAKTRSQLRKEVGE